MSSTTTIPLGSLVLVTGANGYVASHICDRLLHAGYKVRGTVRSAEKVAYLHEVFAARYPNDAFHHVIVPDMAEENAFDEAMDGVAGVVHVATNASLSPDGDAVIKEVLDSVHSILTSAAKHPSVKRFVYTSSAAATTVGGLDKEYHVDASTWNDTAVELAKIMPESREKGFAVYAASKTLGERACFEFAKKEKPTFIINSVIAYIVIGEILHPKQPASSAGLVKSMFEGIPERVQLVKNFTSPGGYTVDVQDTANLHVAALNVEDVQGERLIACGEKVSFNKLLDCMESVESSGKNLPERADRAGKDLSIVDTARSAEVLKKINGKGFTSMQDSVRVNCQSEWESGEFKVFGE